MTQAEPPPPEPPLDAPPEPRRVLLQALGAGVGILVAILAIGWLAREPIQTFSAWVIGEWGLIGLFFLTVLSDPIPGPGHDTALVVGYAGGLSLFPLWAVTSLGTVVSSALCWAFGRLVGRAPWAQRLLTRWKIQAFLDRHGSRAIAWASVLPVPYGPVTIGAGAAGMPFGVFILGACARPIKVLVALLIIAAGWHATG